MVCLFSRKFDILYKSTELTGSSGVYFWLGYTRWSLETFFWETCTVL
jgi:hypothetical protein